MRRKVIQIANSTQLVSLPREWTKRYNVKKGDELDLEIKGNIVEVSTQRSFNVERVELDVSNLEPMIMRAIMALYKRGVDEIKVVYNDTRLLEKVQQVIGKEAVGFEIVDQEKNYCVIKNVSGELGDFESILRRTFLLLITMSNETLNMIKNREFAQLKNVAFLEEANNRFTTSCRRLLNKKGYKDPRKIGPLYYLIEDLENTADEYKYLCRYVASKDPNKVEINKDVIKLFGEVNEMLRMFYEVYYKFDKEKIVEIGKKRKTIIETVQALYENTKLKNTDFVVLHHLIVIMQKTFCFLGPYLVMSL